MPATEAVRLETWGSECALGSWSMCRWAPRRGEPLAGIVDHIWYFDGTTAHRRERVFPTARLEVIVQFDEPHRPVAGDGWEGPYPSACIAGFQVAPRVIEAPLGRMRVLGLRLHPLGAFRLLGVPLDELTGSTFSLVDVLGATARELESRLHGAPDGAARVRGTLHWVARRLERAAESDPAIEWAVNALERDAAVPIGGLQRESGLDRTRFAARFRRSTGVSPKQFARVVRLRATLDLLRGRAGTALGTVAAEAGYYDQPHMNADFRELAGLSPGEFRAAHAYPRSINTAE